MAKQPNIQLKHSEVQFETKQFPIRILANNIEIAGNIGSLFRVADAFGVEKVYLSAQSEAVSKLKIRKAARSAQKKVDYCPIDSSIDQIETLKKKGFCIISLEITSRSQAVREFVQHTKMQGKELGKVCLIIGSEKKGIEQVLLDASDHTLHIPMYGENTSMNVVTATAIVLYELLEVATSSSNVC